MEARTVDHLGVQMADPLAALVVKWEELVDRMEVRLEVRTATLLAALLAALVVKTEGLVDRMEACLGVPQVG